MVRALHKATGKVLSGEDAVRALAAGAATPIREARSLEYASLRHR